jgi:hypothetical protein
MAVKAAATSLLMLDSDEIGMILISAWMAILYYSLQPCRKA